MRVAIACQGGGSHAAFAAGLLTRLLSPELRSRFQLTALSGTSGGALCAALAWSGLVASGPDEAIRRLAGFWHDIQAREPWDAAVNATAVTLARLPITQEVSPYTYQPVAEPTLRGLLRTHVALETLRGQDRTRPHLIVGATEVLSGDRAVFHGEHLGYDALTASAAIPPLFRAVAIGKHRYWDGLFSANPPVREFTDLAEPPDAIWVIQINPQHRDEEPRTVREIEDRRNELSGNLSLGQELFFIQKINALRQRYPELAKRYRHIDLRVVPMALPGLDAPSKLDRSPGLIVRLLAHGAERADWFFDKRSQWPRPGTVPPGPVRHDAAEADIRA